MIDKNENVKEDWRNAQNIIRYTPIASFIVFINLNYNNSNTATW